jgi:hypothetical protein
MGIKINFEMSTGQKIAVIVLILLLLVAWLGKMV